LYLPKKKLGVQIVTLSKYFFCIYLCSTLNANQIPKKYHVDIENIKQLVSGDLKLGSQPKCFGLTKNEQSSYNDIHPFFDMITEKIKQYMSLRTMDDQVLEEMSSHFHPRLGVTSGKLIDFFYDQKKKLETPFEVSLVKIWTLWSPEGRSVLIPCEGGEKSLYPMYGYPLQFIIEMQILGQKDLARLMLSLVPQNNSLKLGSLIAHKKTHGGITTSEWIDKAIAYYKKDDLIKAYYTLDVPKKILQGRGHYRLAKEDKIRMLQDSIFTTRNEWKEAIKSDLSEFNIMYVSTVLTSNSIGILLREKVKRELSYYAMEERCQEIFSQVKHRSWGSAIDGLNCSFILDGESHNKEGIMGSLFVAKNR
jgi:hypothetical protein